MNKKISGIIGFSLILLLNIAVFAQKKADGSLVLESGATVEAVLQSNLDVKKSKVGDRIVLKTTKSVKENGKVVIQKGSSLIGRVSEVQQKTKHNSMSRIGVIFERIEGKNLNAPITASILSVTNLQNSASLGETLDSDISSTSSSTGRVSSGSAGGGGLLGGVANTVGGVVNTTSQTVGGVANTAGQTVGGTVRTVGRTVNGIQISNSVSGAAQTSNTLSAGDKNLRLEKGATFQLQIAGNSP